MDYTAWCDELCTELADFAETRPSFHVHIRSFAQHYLSSRGRSLNGENAFYPQLTAVVSNVGSGYAIPGYNPSVLDPAELQPAWTWGGKEIPWLPFKENVTPEQRAAAEIPVEQINGPVLLISGDGDMLWDSSDLSRVAWDRLQRTEHPWPDQFLNYPGAGHLIGAPYQPQVFDRESYFGFGGDAQSDHVASVNSWRAVLNMLDRRLNYASGG